MEIIIIKAYENICEYIEAVNNDKFNYINLWEKYMIEPFWNIISQWAPFNVDFMKPKPIENIDKLKIQYDHLSKLSIDDIQKEFENICTMLPINDETPMVIALYPLSDDNIIIKERQNGVVGCCVFGNIIININPLANNFNQWIPFVFAHEYNHSAWGHEKYAVQNGKNVEGTFLEYMITEGQADLFAMSIYPKLKPRWNILENENQKNKLWEKIKKVLDCKEREIHEKYMFGNEKEELPWCIGYYFGKDIIENYLNKYKEILFKELINIPNKYFLEEYQLYLG